MRLYGPGTGSAARGGGYTVNASVESLAQRCRIALVRSWLFAPADVTRRATKALSCGAGAAVLDLEDAVAHSRKVEARQRAVQSLRQPHRSRGYVRMNGLSHGGLEDLRAIVGPWLDGVFLPKAESSGEVEAVHSELLRLESNSGMEPGSIDLVPIIESCIGLVRVHDVASASPRVSRLALGAGDFTRDLGIEWTRDERELEYARFQLAVASRAAGLAPPIDTVYIDLADDAGLRESVLRGVRWGFGSKCAIHPAQLGAIHEGYAPAPEAVAQARRIVNSFEIAEKAGEAALRVDGKLVDYAIFEKARALLDLADRHARAAHYLDPHAPAV